MSEAAADTGAEVAVLDIEAAAAKLKQGKDLIDDDPEKAVELLCAAVRSYEKHFGAEAIECAPVYMYYGIALYEVARSATDALGTTKTTVEPISDQKADQTAALPKPAATADEAGDKSSVPGDGKSDATAGPSEPSALDDQKAVEPNDAAGSDDKKNTGEDGDKAAEDGPAEGGDGDGEEMEEEADGAEQGEEEEGGDAKAEDDPDADDMKLAWDMLEVARVIYSKQSHPEEHRDRLAEVHKALGDIKSEQERFEEAVDCYKQSLQHLEAMQTRNNRRLAEVQYKLSVVLTYLEQHEEALAVTQAALNSLEAAVAETEEKLCALPTDGSGGEAADEEGRRLQAVSDDLRSVIGELHWNINGLKETIANDNSLKEALRQAFLKANGGSGSDAAAGLTAALAAGVATSSSFAAPSKPGPTGQPVSLGTVGRGSKRITLQPTSTTAANGTAAPAAVPISAPKRTLDDLMGGEPAAGGLTSTGFEAVAVVEAREEGQPQAAKKARVEEAEAAMEAAES
ncbi:hypothetical protein VOLCADRAFT_108214 [Volvox carteri f. nagariensis]|uniref:Tetratricopeptide SHNi-TPR domain-containing protein n=1 Tax=Volvox carteri f. nagariensis TaxID=3068 RepID=D8UIX9_VOLCA|nr:uncharacterized protein VOLCADRAFT_108214 [Volvox carteri f. nagariensis]EFJ40332.1 hypothetical protein VOLCADRAFT_108214 [Volvox carteri f. nagariensis]|eukprot:XP_002958595.1 hypothetical protein VOLCADRAFT_108214 [Volvox carteri f. nagariensis]